METLIKESEKNCKDIKCISIDNTRIEEIDSIIPNVLKPFKRTLKIKELTWSKHKPNVLNAWKLCCSTCSEQFSCIHFSIGCVEIPKLSLDNISLGAQPESEDLVDLSTQLCSILSKWAKHEKLWYIFTELFSISEFGK